MLSYASSRHRVGLRWSSTQPCAYESFVASFAVYALPNWQSNSSSRHTIDRYIVNSDSRRDAALPAPVLAALGGSHTYDCGVRVPDSAHPLAVEMQLRLNVDGPVASFFSGVVCPNRGAYVASADVAALLSDGVSEADFNAAFTAAVASYTSVCGAAPPTVSGITFAPALRITVPNDRANVGKQVTATFSPASGSPSACVGHTEIYSVRVDFGGRVVVSRDDDTGVSLLDRPVGSAPRCVYDVSTMLTDDSDQPLALPGAAPAISVSAALPTATVAYGLREAVSFPVNLTIDLPTDVAPYVGERLYVQFVRHDGPTRGCDPVTEWYTIRASGAVEPADGSVPALVDQPENSTGHCVYRVRFPLHENHDPASDEPLLVSHNLRNTLVSVARNDARAEYIATPAETAGVCVMPSPVRDLADHTGDADARKRWYRWNTPTNWGGAACQHASGYELSVTRYTSNGLGSLLANGALGGWNGANRTVARDLTFTYDQQTTPGSDRFYAVTTNPHATEIRWHTLALRTYNSSNPADANNAPKVGADTQRVTSTVVCPTGAPSSGQRTTIAAPNTNWKGINWVNTLRDACGYQRPTVFTASININLADRIATAAHVGTRLTVTFIPTAKSPSGCQRRTETYEIQQNDHGDIVVTERDGHAPILLAQTADGTTCQYNVEFPEQMSGDVNIGPTSKPTSTTKLSAAAKTVNVTYDLTIVTRFRPVVTVNTPPGAAHSDKQFTVTFRHTGGPDADCDTDIASVVYTIPSNGGSEATGTAPLLISQPEGSDEYCEYTVGFPVDEDGDGTTLARQDNPAPVTQISGRNDTTKRASVTYGLRDPVLFAPTVEINTPSGATHAGKAFTVRFTRTGGPVVGCTSGTVTRTYTIPDGGGSKATGVAPQLIDQPRGDDGRCVYRVRFLDYENGGTTLEQQSTPTPVTEVSGPQATASVTYDLSGATHFTPIIEISTPLDATHRYNAFTVTFTRTGGPASGCSTAIAPVTYRVLAGSARAVGVTPELVDQPQGADGRCIYTVNFGEHENGRTTLKKQSTPTPVTVIHGGQKRASVTYAVRGPVLFTPTIEISTPTGVTHGNKAFTVTFTLSRGPYRGCSTGISSVVYSIPDGGGSKAVGVTPELVDQPRGIDRHCEYTVGFPADEDGSGTTLTKQSSPAPVIEISGVQKSASVTYDLRGPTHFRPVVTIGTPTGGGHRTKAFTVTFMHSGGPANGCDAVRTATYSIPDGGGSQATGTAPKLVDQPEGVDERCVYHVGFPGDEDGDGFSLRRTAANLDDSTQADIDGTSADESSAGATYSASTATFTPMVAISVPAGAAHGGKAFTVTFSSEQAASTRPCSATTKAVYRVPPGSDTPFGTTPTLIDRPTGTNTSCVYDVQFPVHEDGVTATLVSHDLDTIAFAMDASASATYLVAPNEDEGCEAPPVVRNLRDDGSAGESLLRRYRWNTPENWGGSDCVSRGYRVTVKQYSSLGLGAVLADWTKTSWTVASRQERTTGSQRHTESSRLGDHSYRHPLDLPRQQPPETRGCLAHHQRRRVQRQHRKTQLGRHRQAGDLKHRLPARRKHAQPRTAHQHPRALGRCHLRRSRTQHPASRLRLRDRLYAAGHHHRDVQRDARR